MDGLLFKVSRVFAVQTWRGRIARWYNRADSTLQNGTVDLLEYGTPEENVHAYVNTALELAGY